MFSSPPVTARLLLMRKVVAAPAMRNTPSTLPTRSVTAMVAGAPRAPASFAAWAMMRCTSVALRKSVTVAGGVQLPAQTATSPPPPPQAVSANANKISQPFISLT